jgi:hypothetical protein
MGDLKLNEIMQEPNGDGLGSANRIKFVFDIANVNVYRSI